MEDREITKLYFQRDESAIHHTIEKFGSYMKAVSFGILGNKEDSEECVNTALDSLWKSIPPNDPDDLKAYIAKVTRNVSFMKYDYNTAKKRNCTFVEPLDELDFCISGGSTPQTAAEQKELTQAINTFLMSLSDIKRAVFVRRYFYCSSISQIAENHDLSESKVKSMLFQTRKKLKNYLEKKGFVDNE